MVLASLVDHSLSITDIYDYLFDWCPWTLNMTKEKKLILEIILLTEGRAHSFFHGLISIKERHSVNQLQPHFQKDIHWRLQTGESKSRCKNKNHSTGFTFTYCLFVFLNLDEKVLLLCLHAGCNITGLSVLCKKLWTNVTKNCLFTYVTAILFLLHAPAVSWFGVNDNTNSSSLLGIETYCHPIFYNKDFILFHK